MLLARYGKHDKPVRAVPPISQETLAEMVGTTRSRVNFFMKKFQRLGFIDYTDGLKVNNSLLTVVLHDWRAGGWKTRPVARAAARRGVTPGHEAIGIANPTWSPGDRSTLLVADARSRLRFVLLADRTGAHSGRSSRTPRNGRGHTRSSPDQNSSACSTQT